MKIIQINAVSGKGSTGKICESISDILTNENVENEILYTSNQTFFPNSVKYSNDKYIKFQSLKSRILGNNGFNSHRATKRLIDEIKRFNPDVIHLHNLHGHNCDLVMLFKYLKTTSIKVVWTFHDCWSFTGYCSYFTLVKCDKWKDECNHCPQRKEFSCFFDKSKKLFNRKKELFLGLDLTIVTPSKWLAELVKQSFLKDYPVKVINNGIDLSIFKPIESDFRAQYGLENKYIILGVAFGWGKRKGLDVFIELSKRLNREKFQIVLVGTDDKVDKQLPKEIISIHRTQNQAELAEIYSAADVFANPTREENYPTVNMEAIACGTPVLTFRTGGSPEILTEKTGIVVECDDIDTFEKEIVRICEEKPYSIEDCLKRAASFDCNEKYKEYIRLYEEV